MSTELIHLVSKLAKKVLRLSSLKRSSLLHPPSYSVIVLNTYSVNLQWGWWPQNVFLISEKWKSIHMQVLLLLLLGTWGFSKFKLQSVEKWLIWHTHFLQLITQNSFFIYLFKNGWYDILIRYRENQWFSQIYSNFPINYLDNRSCVVTIINPLWYIIADSR